MRSVLFPVCSGPHHLSRVHFPGDEDPSRGVELVRSVWMCEVAIESVDRYSLEMRQGSRLI